MLFYSKLKLAWRVIYTYTHTCMCMQKCMCVHVYAYMSAQAKKRRSVSRLVVCWRWLILAMFLLLTLLFPIPTMHIRCTQTCIRWVNGIMFTHIRVKPGHPVNGVGKTLKEVEWPLGSTCTWHVISDEVYKYTYIVVAAAALLLHCTSLWQCRS